MTRAQLLNTKAHVLGMISDNIDAEILKAPPTWGLSHILALISLEAQHLLAATPDGFHASSLLRR